VERAADQILEQQGVFWQKRASLVALGLMYLAGHLPPFLALIPGVLGFLGVLGLMAAGPLFTSFLLLRKRPVRKALVPLWISLALVGGFILVGVLNAAAS
jgi:hypothetical protein